MRPEAFGGRITSQWQPILKAFPKGRWPSADIFHERALPESGIALRHFFRKLYPYRSINAEQGPDRFGGKEMLPQEPCKL
ncbi:MAG: hypothetical protein CSA68_00635 [Rhodobacterales bacterium]|nr:MAG: hypothetical protein CSA68_00635 [Rhodobacterales bacterium]